MRKLIWLICFCLTVLLGIGIYNSKNSHQTSLLAQQLREKKESENQALNLTKVFLDQQRPEDALRIIRGYDPFISSATPSGRRWLGYIAQASAQLQDGPQLSAIWGYFPEAFKDKEKESILLGRIFISNGRYDDYQELRKFWENRTTLSDDWFLLDADALATRRDDQQAIKFLEVGHLKGKKDADRLLRLAVEKVKTNPKEAWKNLNEAVALDPDNSVVHLYRARFLEAVGKDENALAEYLSLIQLHPQSLMLKNQMVDFLLRHERYDEALPILKDMLSPPTSDFAWLKAFFWSKVIKPLPYEWNEKNLPQGSVTPLLKYLINLPKNIYWDGKLFDQLPNASQYLKTQQSTLWLRLTQLLRDGKEKEALILLQENAFSQNSYLPKLEKGLLQILTYRQTKTFDVNKSVSTNPLMENEQKIPSESDFFHELNAAAAKGEAQIPSPIKSLITSQEAFAAAFLAVHWNEAAVALHRLDVYPETFPLWMTLKMGFALHQIKGPDQALTFLKQQKQNDDVSLLTAEILSEEKNVDEAISLLLTIKDHQSSAGKEALKMLADIYLAKNDDKKAEEVLNTRKDLSNDIFWQEANAKIAFKRHDLARAEEIYKKIMNQSAQAKSYFARKAFLEGNFNQARELTVELIREHPMNLVLRKNLKTVVQKRQDESLHE